MPRNNNTIFFTLLIACINQLNSISEQRRRAEQLISMNLESIRMLAQMHYLRSHTYFFEIPTFFDAIPFLMVARSTTGTGATRDRNTHTNYHYWEIGHPFLTDDDNPVTSFRATYRLNRSTFERLVNDLSNHEVYQFTAPNALPVYIQISCAIWRLANCHIGYRLINLGWGVSYGSYTNMTRRFITAVKDIYKNVIKWPVDEEKVREIQQGFQHPNGDIGPHRLPRVIGALDGKNIIIHPPSPLEHREFWRDRKGHFSVKLTAICDYKCRFTYISVGDSGIY
jgi:hypothetical protein